MTPRGPQITFRRAPRSAYLLVPAERLPLSRVLLVLFLVAVVLAALLNFVAEALATTDRGVT